MLLKTPPHRFFSWTPSPLICPSVRVDWRIRSRRSMRIWPGECHVHAGIRVEDVSRVLRERPEADLLVHPECGCASQCMYAATQDDALPETTHVRSTEGMVRLARTSPRKEFVVATETGILHRLRREAPEKRFYAMSEKAVCRYMKLITLEKVRDSLRDMRHPVTVPDEVYRRLMAVPADQTAAEGARLAAETIKQLTAIEGVAGVHLFMAGNERAVPGLLAEAGVGAVRDGR